LQVTAGFCRICLISCLRIVNNALRFLPLPFCCRVLVAVLLLPGFRCLPAWIASYGLDSGYRFLVLDMDCYTYSPWFCRSPGCRSQVPPACLRLPFRLCHCQVCAAGGCCLPARACLPFACRLVGHSFVTTCQVHHLPVLPFAVRCRPGGAFCSACLPPACRCGGADLDRCLPFTFWMPAICHFCIACHHQVLDHRYSATFSFCLPFCLRFCLHLPLPFSAFLPLPPRITWMYLPFCLHAMISAPLLHRFVTVSFFLYRAPLPAAAVFVLRSAWILLPLDSLRVRRRRFSLRSGFCRSALRITPFCYLPAWFLCLPFHSFCVLRLEPPATRLLPFLLVYAWISFCLHLLPLWHLLPACTCCNNANAAPAVLPPAACCLPRGYRLPRCGWMPLDAPFRVSRCRFCCLPAVLGFPVGFSRGSRGWITAFLPRLPPFCLPFMPRTCLGPPPFCLACWIAACRLVLYGRRLPFWTYASDAGLRLLCCHWVLLPACHLGASAPASACLPPFLGGCLCWTVSLDCRSCWFACLPGFWVRSAVDPACPWIAACRFPGSAWVLGSGFSPPGLDYPQVLPFRCQTRSAVSAVAAYCLRLPAACLIYCLNVTPAAFRFAFVCVRLNAFLPGLPLRCLLTFFA